MLGYLPGWAQHGSSSMIPFYGGKSWKPSVNVGPRLMSKTCYSWDGSYKGEDLGTTCDEKGWPAYDDDDDDDYTWAPIPVPTTSSPTLSTKPTLSPVGSVPEPTPQPTTLSPVTSVPTPSPTQYFSSYVILSSSTCSESGYSRITSRQACETAADFLSLYYVNIVTSSSYPKGCVYILNTYVYYNIWGEDEGDDGAYETSECTDDVYECICGYSNTRRRLLLSYVPQDIAATIAGVFGKKKSSKVDNNPEQGRRTPAVDGELPSDRRRLGSCDVYGTDAFMNGDSDTCQALTRINPQITMLISGLSAWAAYVLFWRARNGNKPTIFGVMAYRGNEKPPTHRDAFIMTILLTDVFALALTALLKFSGVLTIAVAQDGGWSVGGAGVVGYMLVVVALLELALWLLTYPPGFGIAYHRLLQDFGCEKKPKNESSLMMIAQAGGLSEEQAAKVQSAADKVQSGFGNLEDAAGSMGDFFEAAEGLSSGGNDISMEGSQETYDDLKDMKDSASDAKESLEAARDDFKGAKKDLEGANKQEEQQNKQPAVSGGSLGSDFVLSNPMHAADSEDIEDAVGEALGLSGGSGVSVEKAAEALETLKDLKDSATDAKESLDAARGDLKGAKKDLEEGSGEEKTKSEEQKKKNERDERAE